MKKVYIMSGEELALKQDKIDLIRSNKKDWNYKKIILEDSRLETIKNTILESFMYLNTIDMFNIKPKILCIVVKSTKVAIEFLNELVDVIDENILVLDIRSNDIRGLTSSGIYKKNISNIELLKFNKLEEKTRNNTLLEIKSMLKNENIEFEKVEDIEEIINYIYDNSDYSYTSIRQQIEQMKYMGKSKFKKEDINEFIGQSFNGNYYALINKIFLSKNKVELMEVLEDRLYPFDKNDYIAFFNIFIYTLRDYLRFLNGVKCKNGSNYYQFRNSKLKINDINNIIIDISKLNFSCRIGTNTVKEELCMIMWRYFDEK